MNANGPDAGGERDPKVDAAWRELSDASPPPDLDDSIRAAARRAVHAKPGGPKARAPWPAWMTFAAAASIGVVAIGVWKMMPQEPDELHASASDVPAAAQPAAPDSANATKQANVAAPAPASAPAQAAKVVGAPVPAAPASVPPGKPAPSALPSTAIAPVPSPVPVPSSANTSRAPEAPASTQGFVPAPPPAPVVSGAVQAAGGEAAKPSGVAARGLTSPAGAARNAPAVAARAEAQSEPAETAGAAAPVDAKTATDSVAASPPPAAANDKLVRSFDDYILAIRRALDAKQEDDAVKELQALRKAYPDADERMPVDLRSWAFRIRK